MPRERTRGDIKAVCATQDYRENDMHKLDVWFEHLVSVGRPCAIVKKMYRRQMAYSVWRTIDPEEEEHFKELKTGQLPTEFEIIKEHDNFMERITT